LYVVAYKEVIYRSTSTPNIRKEIIQLKYSCIYEEPVKFYTPAGNRISRK
jgi:hypothetical protein